MLVRLKNYLRYAKRDLILVFKTIFGVGDNQSWKKFHFEVRCRKGNLLGDLNRFSKSILVAGCQRSGTTMLSRVITQSEGMTNYRKRNDDELDAALILSGTEKIEIKGRYCFQTTYLNESYKEYFNKNYDFQLIWILRNPYSVIYSMTYNWGSFSFNELFDACGFEYLEETDKQKYKKYGRFAIPKLKRACLAYNGKISQLYKLVKELEKDRILIVDYDDMVNNKQEILPKIFEFIHLSFKTEYADYIEVSSVNKAGRLSLQEQLQIKNMSVPIYNDLKKLLN